MRNKAEFDKSASELQQYELKLLRQIRAIEQVQESSKVVMNQYKQNIQELQDVQKTQHTVIDELSAIEAELDLILPQYEDSPLFSRPERNMDELPLRDQILHQASTIENDVDALNSKLIDTQQRIDGFMMQNSSQRQRINANNANFSFQSKEEEHIQATNDIQSILGTYYDTLKWIQGTALDL